LIETLTEFVKEQPRPRRRCRCRRTAWKWQRTVVSRLIRWATQLYTAIYMYTAL